MTSRVLALAALLVAFAGTTTQAEDAIYIAPHAELHGSLFPTPEQWRMAAWKHITRPMTGVLPPAADFSGRYRVLWTPQALYLQAEIVDDVISDHHPDPLENYWLDDALEIFVDEDASGGLHLHDDNAYAYHIGIGGEVVDLAASGYDEQGRAITSTPREFPDHALSQLRRQSDPPHALIWELRIQLYAQGNADTPVSLQAGKEIGWMVGYCDSDGPEGRDNLYTDVAITPVAGDRNRGYIDASTFGRLRLAPPRQ